MVIACDGGAYHGFYRLLTTRRISRCRRSYTSRPGGNQAGMDERRRRLRDDAAGNIISTPSTAVFHGTTTFGEIFFEAANLGPGSVAADWFTHSIGTKPERQRPGPRLGGVLLIPDVAVAQARQGRTSLTL